MAGYLAGAIIYDLAWADRILHSFESKHPKSCKAVLEIAELSRNDVLRLLTSNQAGWRSYKRFVKLRDKAIENAELLRAAVGRLKKAD